MTRTLRYTLFALAAVVVVGTVAVALTALDRGPAPAAGSAPAVAAAAPGTRMQASEGGGVQVQVSYTPAAQGTQSVAFDVSLNTHSVELGQFDLAKLSRVTLEPGGALTDLTWQPRGAGGGHHVEGTLTAKDPGGLAAGARTLTLEISGLATPDARRFQWPVKGQ